MGSLEIGKKWLKIAFYFTESDINLPDETFNAHFLHANKHLTCFKPVFMVYSRSQMLFRWSAWRLSATQCLDSYHLVVRCGAHLYMLQFILMLISVQPDCRFLCSFGAFDTIQCGCCMGLNTRYLESFWQPYILTYSPPSFFLLFTSSFSFSVRESFILWTDMSLSRWLFIAQQYVSGQLYKTQFRLMTRCQWLTYFSGVSRLSSCCQSHIYLISH